MFIPDQVNTGHAAALTMNHQHLRIRVLEIAGLHDYHTHSVSLGVLLVHFFSMGKPYSTTSTDMGGNCGVSRFQCSRSTVLWPSSRLPARM